MTRRTHGFTLIELLITLMIIGILTGMAVPLARNSIQREREFALKAAVREMRTAIDKYKEACDRGFVQQKVGTECYPESLEVLVEGVGL